MGVAQVKEERKTGKVIYLNKSQKLKKDGTPKRTHSNSKENDPHEVYPFKNDDEIKAMIQYFINKENNADTEDRKRINARYKMLFIVGINVASRCGDLVELTWGDVFEKDGSFRDWSRKKEQKTGKYRNLFFNTAARKVITEYIEKYHPIVEPDRYVFKSREGGHICVRSVRKALKDAAEACGIKQNIGTHSMRKTFGYRYLRKHNNDALAVITLQKLYGHSSPAITLIYCGITDEESKQCYEDMNLGMFDDL